MRALTCLLALLATACPGHTSNRPPLQNPKCAEADQLLSDGALLRDEGLLGRALILVQRAANLCATKRMQMALASARADLWLDRDLDPSRATDDDKRHARLLYQAGQILRERDEDLATSIERFEQSFELWPHPLTLVQIGLSHGAAGRVVEARTFNARALALAEHLSATAAQPRLLRGHLGNVYAVAYHPKQPLLATTGEEHTIKLWDLSSGRIARNIDGYYGFQLAFGGDGDTLAAADGDGILLWDLASGETAPRRLAAAGTYTFAFDPSGQYVASGSTDGTISLWDTSSGRLVDAWMAHADEENIVSIAFSADGASIASAATDNTIGVWQRDGARVATLLGHTDLPRSIAFHPNDPAVLASGGDDGTLRIWNVTSATATAIPDAPSGAVTSLAFDATGDRVVTGGDGGAVRIWDLASRALLQSITDHTDRVHNVAFSPDDDEVAAVDSASRISLWNANTGQPGRRLDTPGTAVTSLAFGPDSDVLAVQTPTGPRMWSLGTGNPEPNTQPLELPQTVLLGVDGPTVIDPSQNMIAAGTPTEVILRDARTDRVIHRLAATDVHSLAFSPDGAMVACGSDATVSIWRVSDGTQLASLAHPQSVVARYLRAVVFSPDGTILLTAGDAESIVAWDVATWTEVRTIAAHEWAIYDVAYAPDGSLFASASADGLVKLWSASSFELVATLYPTSSPTWAMVGRDGFVDGTNGVDGGQSLLYWQVGTYQLPGFVGWQRNHEPGLLAKAVHAERSSARSRR